jgi:2-methylcitrate dehydratase PrpD
MVSRSNKHQGETFMSLTSALADFGTKLRLEDLPPDVVEKAKICILDAIGVALEGAGGEAAQLAIAYASETKGNGTIWASGARVGYLDAVLANTACVQSILHDDVLMSTFAHPAGPVVCSVLGLGEELRSNGRDALLATVIGYEVMGCIGGGKNFAGAAIARGFRGTPLFGVFASAGVAAKLLALPKDAFQHALGAAASFACGILEPMEAGSMEWRVAAGIATNNGILAAQMARKGLRSAPTALEGRYGFYYAFAGEAGTPQAFIDGPGVNYQIMDNWHKPFPCGSENTWTSAMKLVQGIAIRNNVDPKRVSSIVVRVMGRMLNYPGLQFSGVCETIDKAIMSKPFALAAILMNKTLNFQVYKNQLNDPALYEIAKKVKVEPLGEDRWAQFVAEAEVHMDDGTVYRGDPADLAPIQFYRNRQLASESFMELTKSLLPAPRAKEIVDTVFRLEGLPDVSNLTKLFPR